MAVCRFCHVEMNGSSSCVPEPIHLREAVVDPLPYGSELDASDPNVRCHDCDVVPGGFHHRGCDMEACPVCGGQLISWIALPRRLRSRWTEDHICHPIAVWTLDDIIDGLVVPLLVVHESDGTWQVLDGQSMADRDPALTRVADISDIHASLAEVVELPPGWEAWRDTADSPWTRDVFDHPTPPDGAQ